MLIFRKWKHLRNFFNYENFPIYGICFVYKHVCINCIYYLHAQGIATRSVAIDHFSILQEQNGNCWLCCTCCSDFVSHCTLYVYLCLFVTFSISSCHSYYQQILIYSQRARAYRIWPMQKPACASGPYTYANNICGCD